jgi:hypothetical protein
VEVPRRGGPNFSFAGFLLLTAFGTFLWKSIPLESSRPPTGESQWHPSELSNQVPARLWQDPFEAVLEHTGSRTGRKPDTKQTPKSAGEDRHEDIPDCRLDILNKSIEQKQTRVIAAMLTAGPDAELTERRRRRRYAVVSGLGAAGLVPQSASSIRYCYLQKAMPNHMENKYIVPYELYTPDPTGAQAEQPYAILLLWVNETIFTSEPMGRFANMAEQIAGLRKSKHEEVNTRFFVLGPASSDTLRKLAERASDDRQAAGDMEELKERFSGLAIDGLHILSPVATVPRSQFTSDSAQQERFDKLGELFAPRHCLEQRDTSGPCVSFFRTIPTDDKLADLLASELIEKRPWDVEKDHIALVSEWDTNFGRSLPEAFKTSYCERSGQCNDANAPKVLEYSYLRGIDGRIQGARDDNQGKGKNGSKKDDAKNGDLFDGQNKRIVRRPAGTAQFDYLRRLAAKIRSKNGVLKAEGKGKVAAIGILGSDVYDKLLIMRALRPQFPQALFFTTDLDAQLLHPADFRWARNLIVASSFGLDLKRDLQGKIPPFRGNYQTSMFLTTLLATKFDHPYGTGLGSPDTSIHDDFMQRIPPLLFEIGRHGAERLSPVHEESNTVHPLAPESSIVKNTWYIFLIILLLIAAAHQSRPFSGWLVIWSLLALLFAANLAIVAIVSSNSGEPMSLTSGISIWPTEFIRYTALCLSIYFISVLILDLRANCARISRDKLQIRDKRFDSEIGYDSVLAQPATLAHLWKSRRNRLFGSAALAVSLLVGSYVTVRFGNEYPWMARTLVFCLVTILILLLGICYKRVPWIAGCLPAVLLVAFGMPLTEKIGAGQFWFPPLYWFSALAFWFYLIYKWYPPAHRVDSINNWMNSTLQKENTEVVDAKQYWLDYCKLGQPKGRWYRALSLWLLFMAFGSMVFSITGFPVTPCRGALSCGLDKALVITSVSSMLLLIFLVLDEFRLTVFWIKGLTRIKNMSWAGITGDHDMKTSERLNLLSHESFKIELIAERTEEIGHLIYYPFLIIIIMLISRSSYFDNWGLPQGLAIVVLINILMLISAGAKVRHEAEKCRREVLERMNAKLLEVKGCSAPSSRTDIAQIQQIISDVKSLRNGAFQPFTEQPLLRASLLLFGAIGITAGEYLTVFN